MAATMLTNGKSNGFLTKPCLYVEVCASLDTVEPSRLQELSETVSSWLYDNFLVLTIGEHLRDLCKILILARSQRTN